MFYKDLNTLLNLSVKVCASLVSGNSDGHDNHKSDDNYDDVGSNYKYL